MRIDKPEIGNNFQWSYLRRFSRKNTIRYIGIFIAYNLALALVVATIYKAKVPQTLKQEIDDRISLEKIPSNLIKGLTGRPEQFDIDIKHNHLQKLAYVREISLERGLLYDFEENEVPAIFQHNGQSYRVSLRLKGVLRSHWESEDMFSLKVKVKDDKTIMGMRSFALQHPSTRNYISEWVLHKLFRDEGILSLRYDFVSVNINGRGSRIYALEEGFDKRLVEHNHLKQGPVIELESGFRQKKPVIDNLYSIGMPQDLWSSVINPIPQNTTLRDSTQRKLFNKAKSLLEAFRQDRLKTSDIFDVDKMAKYLALVELFGSHHAASLDNIRFYYNPITGRLEPITHDNDHLDHLSDHGLLGAQKRVGDIIEFRSYGGWWKLTNWYEAIFKDIVFFQAYIKALEEISHESFLTDFFNRHQMEFSEKQRILLSDYPLLSLDPAPILYENQQYIINALNPRNPIRVYHESNNFEKNTINIKIVNHGSLPIQIMGVTHGDSLDLKLLHSDRLVQAAMDSKPPASLFLCVQRPTGNYSPSGLVEDLIVSYKILGSKRIARTKVQFDPYMAYTFDTIDLSGYNFQEFKFLNIDTDNKVVRFKEGHHVINKNLLIPSGFSVFAHAGVKLDLVNHSRVVTLSPIRFIGAEKNPILIHSTDGTGSGFLVYGTSRESTLKFVQVDNLSSSKINIHPQIAPISFFQSPVTIDHCRFSGNSSGEYYLLINDAEFELHSSVFYEVFAGAFASIESNGLIRQCLFFRSKTNAVGLLSSVVDIEDTSIKKVGGTAIRARFESSIFLTRINIEQAAIGVESRDKSHINIKKIKLKDVHLDYLPSEKHFDPGMISIDKTVIGL